MFNIPTLIVILLLHFHFPESIKSTASIISASITSAILYIFISLWNESITIFVPDPYLDEVFHIPQAQAYCDGRFDTWDPKLTTPPGLYILASLKSFVSQNLAINSCSVHDLRTLNSIALFIAFFYACICRFQITQSSADTIHTGFNIALFPPLFFFSGLFYTDVLSICSVLILYKYVLERRKTFSIPYNKLWLFIIGVSSVSIRQTNIFWTAIFSGALEVVNALSSENFKQNESKTCSRKLQHYENMQFHDVLLNKARAHDIIHFIFSFVSAIIFRPGFVIKTIWPQITLLSLFGSFVFWNGGVVLGDKKNHVATIHLPQMLYIWPLITFFSAPLIVPVGFEFLLKMKIFFLKSTKLSTVCKDHVWSIGFILGALIISVLAVNYNTIIHPFTLADNRHYMFYIFHYTILRHSLIRFFLVPIYLICCYLVYLVTCERTPVTQRVKSEDLDEMSQVSCVPQSMNAEYKGINLSSALILLTTTTLSLITCPLVEPRYFITPWILWRLNLPLLHSQKYASFDKKTVKKNDSVKPFLNKIRNFCKIPGCLLWLETIWFMLINLVTGYVFLRNGFEWQQEPGRVQRFIW